MTANNTFQSLITLYHRFIHTFKSLWFKPMQAELAITEPIATDNPYIAARHEWNHRFYDIIKAKHNWQRIAFCMGIGNILLIIGLISVSLQSKVIPYAVNVDNLGNATFAGYLNQGLPINPLEVNAFVRRYISNMRAVIADPIAQKEALTYVYDTTLGEATHVLNDYYRTNSPFTQAQQTTTEIDVNATIQKSDNTWQVDWTETQRNLDGTVVSTTHWEALLSVTHQAVTDANLINVNPLGLFVDHLSWSQQL